MVRHLMDEWPESLIGDLLVAIFATAEADSNDQPSAATGPISHADEFQEKHAVKFIAKPMSHQFGQCGKPSRVGASGHLAHNVPNHVALTGQCNLLLVWSGKHDGGSRHAQRLDQITY